MSAPAGLPETASPAEKPTRRVEPRRFCSEEERSNVDPELNRKLIDRRAVVDSKGVQWHSEPRSSRADAEIEAEKVDREADGEQFQAQADENFAFQAQVSVLADENSAFQAQLSVASNISMVSRTTNNSVNAESFSRQASSIDKLVNTISFQAVNKAMREAVRTCRFCVSIADPKGTDYPLIAVSEEFEEMTGYRRTEILGVNCRFLNQGCDVDPAQLMGLRMASQTGAPFTALLPNRKKSGELFLNLLDVRGLTIARNAKTGDDVWFLIGIQADVSELADDEETLEENMEGVKVLADEIRVSIKKELQQMAFVGYIATAESLPKLSAKPDSGDETSTWELLAEPVWRPGSQLGQRQCADYSEAEKKSYGASAVVDRAALSTVVEDAPHFSPTTGTMDCSTGERPVPPHKRTGSVVSSASSGRDILLFAAGVSAVGLVLTMCGRWIARRRV